MLKLFSLALALLFWLTVPSRFNKETARRPRHPPDQRRPHFLQPPRGGDVLGLDVAQTSK